MPDGSKVAPAPLPANAYIAACVAAFAALAFSGAVLNAHVYSRVADYFGYAREMATLVGGLSYLSIALAARFRPAVLHTVPVSAVAVVLSVATVPLLIASIAACDPVATTLCLAVRAVVRAWANTLLALCLMRLRSLTSVVVVVALGSLASSAARPLLDTIDALDVAATALFALYALPTLWMMRYAAPVLERIRTGGAAADMEMASPQAFLRPSHALFLCALLFSTASGYAMCLNEVGNAPARTSTAALALMFAVVAAVAFRGKRQEDALFSFSVLLVMAGFLVAPLTFGIEGSTTANLLITLGENCFDVLLWLVIVGVGRRNLFALLPVFGLVRCVSSLGTDVGAMAGHTSNLFIHGDTMVAEAFALGLAFVFFAFLWLGFRRFSFTEAIFGIEDVPAEQPRVQSAGERIERRCAELSEAHGLTEREREIFTMLAKGRNGRFIMEHYVISRNTVKSHIKHIYTKLGVHSQQELIDMVEAAG